MLDLLLTPLSAMSISPERSSINSSRSASSSSDQDAGRVSWVSSFEKSCFLELNRRRNAVLVLRPLEPGICQLGDFTGSFLPRDGRTGPKLIAESGVKRRLTSAGPSAKCARLRFCNSAHATLEPRTLAYPGYIPQKHVQL